MNTPTHLRTEDRLKAIGVLAGAPHLPALFERHDTVPNAGVTFKLAIDHIEMIAHQVSREVSCTPDEALLMLIYAIVQRWQDEPERAPRPSAGRPRPVELYRLWPNAGGDVGTWDTAYEYVPINTPESRLEEVAIALHRAHLQRQQQDVAGIGVYSILPNDELGDEDSEPGIFAALRNPTHLARLVTSAMAQLDDYVILLTASDLAVGDPASERLREQIREMLMRSLDEWPARTLDTKLDLLGWLLTALEMRDRLSAVENAASLTGEALADYTIATIRLDLDAAQAL